MDSRAFDELSKQLGEKTSRGRALKLFGGALVGTLVGAREARANPPQKHCKFQGYNCGDNTDCCSLNCCNRTCCGNGQTCCGGQCVQCPSGQMLNTTTCQCVSGTSPPPPPPGGCQNVNDCPPRGVCETVTCTNGTCTYTPNDALCPPAPQGSCQRAACLNGMCTFVPDDSNLPTCGECSIAGCSGGMPFCAPKPVGTPCSNGVCDGVGNCGCPAGTTDCNGVCVDTNSNVANCGGCGVVCTAPNAVPGCVNGQCVITACFAGFANCDGNPANGCETNVLTDVRNCGGCGHVCTCVMGAPVCAQGVCTCV